jgi:hypothetical protein
MAAPDPSPSSIVGAVCSTLTALPCAWASCAYALNMAAPPTIGSSTGLLTALSAGNAPPRGLVGLGREEGSPGSGLATEELSESDVSPPRSAAAIRVRCASSWGVGTRGETTVGFRSVCSRVCDSGEAAPSGMELARMSAAGKAPG